MTNTHRIRRMMSLSPKARAYARTLAAVIVAASMGCKQDSLLQVSGVCLIRADKRRHEVVQPQGQGRLANLPRS